MTQITQIKKGATDCPAPCGVNQAPGTVNRVNPLLRVIEAVADGPITLAELEARLPELSRAKVYRALQEAEAAGWLRRERDGWTLSLKVQRLWIAAVEAKRKEAEKIIEELKILTDPQRDSAEALCPPQRRITQITQIKGGGDAQENRVEDNPPAAAGGGADPAADAD